MTNDRTELDDKNAADWLDGLAGRDGASRASQEGQRLRAALDWTEETDSMEAPPWSEVVRKAGVPMASGSELPVAANEGMAGRMMRWPWALAAAVVMATGLSMWHWSPDDVADGMRGAGGSHVALWRTASPNESANALAQDLRELGATVQVSADAKGILVRIEASEASRPAVNARLAEISAALDSRGHEQVLIVQLAAP